MNHQPAPLEVSPPPPAFDASALVQCTMALAEARGEVRKLLRFFRALSTTGQNIVDVHVYRLYLSCQAIVQRGENTKILEQEREVSPPPLSPRAISTWLTDPR